MTRVDQLAIHEAVGADYPAQRVYKDVIVVAVAETPLRLFDITVEMFGRDLMERDPAIDRLNNVHRPSIELMCTSPCSVKNDGGAKKGLEGELALHFAQETIGTG